MTVAASGLERDRHAAGTRSQSMVEAAVNTGREERITGTDDVALFVRSWRPDGRARGVVALVPGFNAHSGYYAWAAEQLTASGLAVYAVDLRGRGRSDGERFYVRNFEDYVNDVATVIALAKSREPDRPVFLLGHSAGGVVACLYVIDHPDEVAGLICESVAYDIPAPDFALAVFKGLSHVAAHTHILHLKNELFSRDPAVVQAMNDDLLIADEMQPTQTVAELVRADERLKKECPSITLPVLILHGTADKATSPSGSQRFYENAGSSDKTLTLYEGHFHDLLNDIDKESVMADIAGWINARLPASRP
jgi:alpha-beta hydrolase superfamily lysophospholipase